MRPQGYQQLFYYDDQLKQVKDNNMGVGILLECLIDEISYQKFNKFFEEESGNQNSGLSNVDERQINPYLDQVDEITALFDQ